MVTSNKMAVKLLAKLAESDWRTFLGRNLGIIQKDLGEKQLSTMNVKRNLKYFEVPADQNWRVNCLKELLEVQLQTSTLSDFSNDDVKTMINLLCRN